MHTDVHLLSARMEFRAHTEPASLYRTFLDVLARSVYTKGRYDRNAVA